jgi:hypothetical protein
MDIYPKISFRQKLRTDGSNYVNCVFYEQTLAWIAKNDGVGMSTIKNIIDNRNR